MNAKTNADDFAGAQVLSNEELMQVQGGQEEVLLAPFLAGYVAEKVIDYGLEAFGGWSNTVTHAPYTDSYSQAIDAANQAQTQQEMAAQMDQMSGQGEQGGQGDQGGDADQGEYGNQGGSSGDQGGYPSNGGQWEYGGGYGG